MALALGHFRSIPPDIYTIVRATSDSVPALVGCVTTAAAFQAELDDDSVMDLVVRASDRVDEVLHLMDWLAGARPAAGQYAIRDALSALKMTLGVLKESWVDLGPEERQNLLESALKTLARFCYLSRPAGSVSLCPR